MKSKKNPFFSVIITTFNRANILPIAIDSVLEQTEQDFEIIISDDGSTDNTFQIAKDYAEKEPDIITFHYHCNKGPGYSKNIGLFLAKGEYITFLDSDDKYLPEHLFTRKKLLIENPDIDFIHGGCEIIGNIFVPDLYNPSKNIHLEDCVIGGTFFVKRESAIKIGGFSELRFGDDTEFFEGKLMGSYDWIYRPQFISKSLRNKSRN